MVSGQARRGDEEITGGVQKVSVVECECEVVAQKVGTTILFRRIYSGDVKSDSEKCWLHTTVHASVVYGIPRLSAHS